MEWFVVVFQCCDILYNELLFDHRDSVIEKLAMSGSCLTTGASFCLVFSEGYAGKIREGYESSHESRGGSESQFKEIKKVSSDSKYLLSVSKACE